MRIKAAFLNCNNLFHPTVITSRPKPNTERELREKIRHLSISIRSGRRGVPELVGLCEVGSEDLANRLAKAISPNKFAVLWSGDPRARVGEVNTALAILYNPRVFSFQSFEKEEDTGGPLHRTHWLAANLDCRVGSGETFCFVVNHWPSQLGGESLTDPGRMRSASQLAEFFHRNAEQVTDLMLAVGDFNCEPQDRPFKPLSGSLLRAVRERQLVLRTNRKFAYFYNPMWRHLGEADHYERARREGYIPKRLLGTFCN